MSQKAEKIDAAIDALVETFEQINYGDHFESSDTWEAAQRLEELPIFVICEDITKLDDLSMKWKLAIKLTNEVSKIIVTAEECAGPMVDGTKGEFCFAAAEEIQDLWSHICQLERDAEQKVGDEISGEVTTQFENSLGRFANITFIKTHPDKIPPIRTVPDANEDDEGEEPNAHEDTE